MRYATASIRLPRHQRSNLALDLRQHTAELVTCFQSMLQRICLRLEGAPTDASYSRRTERQGHDPVPAAISVLDLTVISKEMTTSLLRLIVLFIGESCICDCDHSYLFPLEMSLGKTEFHLVTLVCQLDDSIRITQLQQWHSLTMIASD